MKHKYIHILFFLFASLFGFSFGKAQNGNDDDVYNAGEPLQDQNNYYQDSNQYYNRYYAYPRVNIYYYYGGCYHPCYHPHWWWGWWRPYYYCEGGHYHPYHRNIYYAHRNQVSPNMARKSTPNTKPISSRGGFGSTGRGGSFGGHHGGFSGGHSAGS